MQVKSIIGLLAFIVLALPIYASIEVLVLDPLGFNDIEVWEVDEGWYFFALK
jgi:hypothetical protein